MSDEPILTGNGLEIPEKYLIFIDGKPFILYGGLLHLAHETARKANGYLTQTYYELKQIPSKENEYTAIVTVRMAIKDGQSLHALQEFFGTGDASPASVTSIITPHLIRMAETRAIARAFRLMTNVGLTAFEELGDLKEAYEEKEMERKKERQERRAAAVNRSKTETEEPKSQRDVLLSELKKIKSDKKLSKDALKNKLSFLLNKKIEGVTDLTDEDLQKTIKMLKDEDESIKDIDKRESTVTPEPPPETEETQTRTALVKEIKDIQDKYNMTNPALKKFISKVLDLPENFKSSELTTEQLTTIRDRLGADEAKKS